MYIREIIHYNILNNKHYWMLVTLSHSFLKFVFVKFENTNNYYFMSFIK